MDVTVVRGDITQQAVDAIVNPANSAMDMGGGAAAAIKAVGGASIQRAAQEQAPVPVGEAVITQGGDLPAAHVIHAPTMERPAQRVTVDNTRKAMRAALRCAEENGVTSLATPGLGTGVGGVAPADAAWTMVDEVTQFSGETLETVHLVAYDDALAAAFRDAVGDREEPKPS